MSFSNPDGVQWVDLILSKSHIPGPFRSQNSEHGPAMTEPMRTVV